MVSDFTRPSSWVILGFEAGFTLGFKEVSVRVNRMSERITVNPDICNGKPVIRGTRITVQTVLEFLTAGDSVEEVLEEYPTLKREDVQACLGHASKLMANH